MQRTDLGAQRGKKTVGRIQRAALTFLHDHVHDAQLGEADAQHRALSSALCADPEGWGGREEEEAGGICVQIADSLSCTAKTNTTL